MTRATPSVRLTAIWTIASIVALVTPAGAVLCKAKNHALVVRSACRTHERQVAATDPLFKGAKGEQGDPGPQGAGPGTHVVDASGKDVGAVLNSDGGSALVLRQIGGDLFTFRVGTGGLLNTLSPYSVYYTRADCGPPSYLLAGYTQSAYDSAAGIASDAALAYDLFVDEARTTGYFTRTSEALEVGQTTPLYQRVTVPGVDAQGATAACTGFTGGGTIVGSAASCNSDAPAAQLCVPCCVSAAYTNAGAPSNGVYRPPHAIDVGGLGLSPPFAFRR